jgi:DNA-binding response OmpR family regulator
VIGLGWVHHRVEGLEAGGDDYLQKPFAMAELLARINAPARRPPGARPLALQNLGGGSLVRRRTPSVRA